MKYSFLLMIALLMWGCDANEGQNIEPTTDFITSAEVSGSYTLDDLREIGTVESVPSDYTPKLAGVFNYKEVYLYWVDSHDKPAEVYLSDEHASASKLNIFDKKLETGEIDGHPFMRCKLKGSTCLEVDGTIVYHAPPESH